MQRVYVLLIGSAVLLIPLILDVAFPLGLSLVILAGFFIAHFSKKEEEAVNMIITVIIAATVSLLIGLIRLIPEIGSIRIPESMIHNSPWILLLLVGSFFTTLILMTIGAMINAMINKIISSRTKPKEA
ncbi:hypothetical protein DNK57_04550 [Methanothermobacter thermautotrophicus]|uniref:Uncharacterized protein n=2 Tax=Methanothermobacter thermautotrophicus TaxID=145262 RepID=A0A842YL52_METTF|nr:hypothetical protein [Methanothermobacter thermautotrophicus]